MDLASARSVLGMSAGASDAEIDRAFRAVAATSHPDRGGDETFFRAAVEARAVLKRSAGLARTARPEVRIMPRRSFRHRVLGGLDRRQRRRYPRVDHAPGGRRRTPLR